jgi:hypothetical protein
MFKNLYHLNFKPLSIYYQVSFNVVSLKNMFSSNLLILYINVEDFTDCLYVLDGRLTYIKMLSQINRVLPEKDPDSIIYYSY